MKTKLLYPLVLFFIFYSAFFLQAKPKPAIKCKYLLYLPENYSDTKETYPLVIYLHGKSHRGNNLNKLKGYGPPFYIDKGRQFNFILASPQCPETTYWSAVNWFDSLYAELTSRYRIDTSRVSVIGISLGGYGAWQAAIDHPDKLSAIAPLCGGCADSLKICGIKHIPIWAFHGSEDKLVNIKETESLVDRLKECGGNVKYSRLEGKGHDITYLFGEQEIYDWLISQKKK
jgi:predicted peptidase